MTPGVYLRKTPDGDGVRENSFGVDLCSADNSPDYLLQLCLCWHRRQEERRGLHHLPAGSLNMSPKGAGFVSPSVVSHVVIPEKPDLLTSRHGY